MQTDRPSIRRDGKSAVPASQPSALQSGRTGHRPRGRPPLLPVRPECGGCSARLRRPRRDRLSRRVIESLTVRSDALFAFNLVQDRQQMIPEQGARFELFQLRRVLWVQPSLLRLEIARAVLKELRRDARERCSSASRRQDSGLLMVSCPRSSNSGPGPSRIPAAYRRMISARRDSRVRVAENLCSNEARLRAGRADRAQEAWADACLPIPFPEAR